MLSNYMMNFWAPPDSGGRYSHHERFEIEEDGWIVFGLAAGVWFSYWLILHWFDHFTFGMIAWYFEIASFIPVVAYFLAAEEYGTNPLKWWPMWFGYSVECKENEILDHKQIKKLGGPYNVYQISTDTIKFRRQKDAFKYTMFDYRP
jgi:hypothetical protein|tara:strand:- start:837 stop:1277 length:441 start_codon:yes stop_codon:yes gene_type:complete